MFYITKRTDEKQCNVGDRVMLLADFSGLPAGTLGQIEEIYSEGVMIEWFVEQYRIGRLEPSTRSDGFSREEFQYLAFATQKHPDVDPTVYNYKHQ